MNRPGKKNTQENKANNNKFMHINNYLKYKLIKCSNRNTDRLNGNKNKIHINVVDNTSTSDLGTHTDYK